MGLDLYALKSTIFKSTIFRTILHYPLKRLAFLDFSCYDYGKVGLAISLCRIFLQHNNDYDIREGVTVLRRGDLLPGLSSNQRDKKRTVYRYKTFVKRHIEKSQKGEMITL